MKMTLKAAKKEENPLFVGLTKGEELRRNMLESSKEILESLRSYENFRNIRGKKVQLINAFKEDIKDIAKLMGALKASLPKVKETGIKRNETEKPNKEKTTEVKTARTGPTTEMERLEAELNKIEEKLNAISG